MNSVFRKARALVSDEKNWTTNSLARDAAENPVSPYDPSAVCWCVAGALTKAGENKFFSYARLREVTWLLEFHGPVTLNDTSSHDLVLWMFDLAIAMEEVGE